MYFESFGTVKIKPVRQLDYFTFDGGRSINFTEAPCHLDESMFAGKAPGNIKCRQDVPYAICQDISLARRGASLPVYLIWRASLSLLLIIVTSSTRETFP